MGEKAEVSPRAVSRQGGENEKQFFVEDDRRSKITTVSVKTGNTGYSHRSGKTGMSTTKTISTEKDGNAQTKTVDDKKKGKMSKAKSKMQSRFRESSILRIIASGLVIASLVLLLFGEFLPFWTVYTKEESGTSVGYYEGLWNYCTLVSGGSPNCRSFDDSALDEWFRIVRGFELMSFIGMLALVGLVIAYMFFLREKKYWYIQPIIIALCFVCATFNLIGIIVFGANCPNSSHISSSFGLTLCSAVGCIVSGTIFLVDKFKTETKWNIVTGTTENK